MSILMLAIMAVVSVALITYALLSRGSDEQDTVRRRMRDDSGSDANVAELREQAKTSVAKKMMERVAPFAVRPVMPQNDAEMTRLRAKLSNAGFRRDSAPTLFLASKTMLGIGLGVVAGLVCYSKGMETKHLFGYTVFVAGMGFMAPNIWLSMAVSRRADQVRKGLPDSLDLMVISVEAGLALDAAIQRVGDEMKNVHPILSEEFAIATWETQMGIPRAETLTNLATRTGVAEVKSLVAILNQAEKFGTSVASALRNQSNALRTKRRQAAEEAAQKTTVKLMAPLILFIFPAIFVVLAGPAALRMIEAMSNNPNL
jgi:tight adherence protein C